MVEQQVRAAVARSLGSALRHDLSVLSKMNAWSAPCQRL